jgi:sugar transferase (PEP-CTERM system associated)
MIRLFGYYVPRTYALLGAVEAAVFFGAFLFGVLVRFGWTIPPHLTSAGLMSTGALFAVSMSVSMISMGLYQRGAHEREAGFVVRLALAFLLGIVLLTLVFYTVPSVFMGRGVLGLSLIFSFVGVTLIREIFGRLAIDDSRKRRVLVLGAGVNARSIEELVARDSSIGFSVVGYVPLPSAHDLVTPSKVIAQDRPLLDLAITLEVDEVVVAADDRRKKLPVADLLDCKMSGFEVLDLLTFFEKELALVRIDLLHPSWIFLSTTGFRMGVTGIYGKRLFDGIVGLAMLAVAAPIMLVVATASLIESGGRDPVFYHQIRVGRGGKPFRLHKFRSMRTDAEADGVARWASQGDARVTRLGAFLRKTRLDELPQLVNVVKGEMSLVGPRPERPEFVEKLTATIPYYAERHRVNPGVTGWAQLLYPYGYDEEGAKRKLEYDLYYVKHAGVVLDLMILLQTVEIVLFGKGAR